MTRSRLWWLAFAVVQIALPTVTAWAVMRTEIVQNVRRPPRAQMPFGEVNIYETRGYPLVWEVQSKYYDLSPDGEIEGEGRSVVFRHWMLPILQMLLALTIPGTLFTLFHRRPAWPIRWVRVFFLTTLATVIMTMADVATEQHYVRSWNEHWSIFGPLLKNAAVERTLDHLAEKRTAYGVVSTYPPRGSGLLSSRCLLFSLVVVTLAYRPWRRQA